MQNTSMIHDDATAVSRGPNHATTGTMRPRRTLITLVGAVIAGLLVWAVAVPVGGLELDVGATGPEVGPLSICVAALVSGAAAWLLLALMIRRPRGRARWTAIAGVILALSLAGPVLSGAVGAVLMTFELMHLLVGSVLIIGLRLSVVPQPAARRTVTAEAS